MGQVFPVTLPFLGTWKVTQGHNGELTHQGGWKHALDFEIVDPGMSPEEALVRDCSATAIRDALATLPERYRVCVDMYFFYDMPYADIGDVTGLPVNTIKSHVFRAKKLLRARLDEGENA